MYEDLRLKFSVLDDRGNYQKQNRQDFSWKWDKNEKTRKLDKLLNDWLHYFDTGYVCPMSPEELREQIIAEIDAINIA